MSRHLARDWWERTEKAAGIARVPSRGWHSLRRKFATELKGARLVRFRATPLSHRRRRHRHPSNAAQLSAPFFAGFADVHLMLLLCDHDNKRGRISSRFAYVLHKLAEHDIFCAAVVDSERV